MSASEVAQDFILLPAPSGNRVYAGAAAELAAAEIELVVEGVIADSVRVVRLGGVDQVAFRAPHTDSLARLSSRFVLFRTVPTAEGEALVPYDLPEPALDDDLVTIPKYQGKTNEQFTRLMINLALSTLPPQSKPYEIMDPMSGRGTTAACAWLLGHHGYGVEVDAKAIEAQSAHLTTWLRRKRLKHKIAMTPVRREGRNLGRRLDATVMAGGTELELGVYTGDTRDSLALWGKRRFDAVITDAPYGVVHGSHHATGRRTRSAAELLAETVPIWARLLRPHAVMAIAWNTLGLSREDLLAIMVSAGLSPRDDGPWRRLSHRVDSSIVRDIAVATKP